MTAYELRKALRNNDVQNDGGLFNKQVMRLTGDTMSNLGVREMGRIRYWEGGRIREVDALSLYRRKSVGGLHGELIILDKLTGEVINAESYEVVV
jgi:hypothetical protein